MTRPLVRPHDLPRPPVDGACAGMDVNIWFPDARGRRDLYQDPHAEAVSICLACPALQACRQYAEAVEAGITARHIHGVLAGLTPEERVQNRRENATESEPRRERMSA